MLVWEPTVSESNRNCWTKLSRTKMELLLSGAATSTNWNLNNFQAFISVSLDQKCSISSQPIPKHQAKSGLYTYFPVPSHSKQSWSLAPRQSDIFYCLFLVLYSLSYKSFLPSALFCHSPKGKSVSWSVKNCLYHLKCLLYF